MNSKLFLDICTAFKDAAPAFITAGVKPVAFIDRFRGQPLNPEQFEYYELPAMFLQSKIDWVRTGRNYNATLKLSVHLVTEPTWDMSSIASNQEEGLKYYRYVEQVRNVFDNLQTAQTGTFFRDTDENVDAGVVFYDILGYEVPYYEASTINPVYEEDEDPDMDVDITDRDIVTGL